MKTKIAPKKLHQHTITALHFLSLSNPLEAYWSDEEYKAKLKSYIKAKGEEALQALAGFRVWCVNNLEQEKQESMISTTFAHDLGQQDDKWMLPRSSSYVKFWKEQQAKKK